MSCLSFSLWLTSLSMKISRPIHVAANGIIPFCFMAIIPCVYINIHIYLYEYICI